MFINNLKLVFRSINRNKGYASANIIGLSIGIAVFMIIAIFVRYELSYDGHHEDADRIYRIRIQSIVEGRTQNIVTGPSLLASTLESECPEVERAVRIAKYGFPVFRYKDKVFSEERVFRTDNSIFEVFTFQFIAGDPESALTDPMSIVLTESTAKKYFDQEDPIGKIINSDRRRDFTVTGVIRDIPDNAHFHFDFLLRLSEPQEDSNWLNLGFRTYVLLRENTDIDLFSKKLKDVVRKYVAPQIEEYDMMAFDNWLESGNTYDYLIQPLTGIHLNSNYDGEFEANGNKTTLYLVSIIAIAVLIISCINYINLETARASKRFHEMGMRKILGADAAKIAAYLFTESTIMSVLSFSFALSLVAIFLPVFNRLFEKSLSFFFVDNLSVIPLILLFVLLIATVTGLGPSIALSSVKTSTVLSGFKYAGKRTSRLRGALVVFQFAASIFVIVATFIVFSQIKYGLNMKLGFDKDQLLVIKKVDDIARDLKTFKSELQGLPGVIEASNSSTIPGKGYGRSFFRIYGGSVESNVSLSTLYADYDFLETYQLNLIQGRNFSTEFSTDKDAVIINQTAARAFRFEEPVGKDITPIGSGIKLQIIGVVEDFHFNSVHEQIPPVVMAIYSEGSYGRYFSVRIRTTDIHHTLKKIEEYWHQFAGNQDFEYAFLDSEFEGLYNSEERLAKLFSTLALLAILIACLGLFGLAYFTINEKTKEIGIRKVLGASVPTIIIMLVQESIKWVFWAAFIAWPITYFLMNKWLQNFAYSVDINIWIFLLSGLAALVIALLTVSYQILRAARANPAKSLRYE